MVVMMLLRQFKNGFTAFKIMAGHDTGIVKLVQHTVYGCQTDFFTMSIRRLYKSSALT